MSKPAYIFAELKEIEYVTKLSDQLEVFSVNDLIRGRLSSKGSFILNTGKDECF